MERWAKHRGGGDGLIARERLYAVPSAAMLHYNDILY